VQGVVASVCSVVVVVMTVVVSTVDGVGVVVVVGGALYFLPVKHRMIYIFGHIYNFQSFCIGNKIHMYLYVGVGKKTVIRHCIFSWWPRTPKCQIYVKVHEERIKGYDQNQTAKYSVGTYAAVQITS